MTGSMLTIRSLKSFYDTFCALKAVSLHVNRGEIVTLIGGNGSGKSTLLKAVLGLVPRSSGSVTFEERELLGLQPSRIVKAGISLVPEGRQLFSPMTVIDNLLLGTYPFYRRGTRRRILEKAEWIFTVFPVLAERRKQLAGTLSGGEQQMLSIARALMAEPKLLLLDEPSIGLAPKIVEGIFDSLVALKERSGLTVFLVEQNARLALDICQRGYVIETGQVILSGERDELRHNKELLRAYLGKE